MGGVTTVFDMPIMGEPYTINALALAERMKLARARLWVDCGFLGLATGDTIDSVRELVKAGAFGLVVNYGSPQFYGVSPFSSADLKLLQKFLADESLDVPILAYCDLCPKAQLDLRSPYRTKPPEERILKEVAGLQKTARVEAQPGQAVSPCSELPTSSPLEEEKTTSPKQLAPPTLMERRASRVNRDLRLFVFEELSCRSAGSSNHSEDSDGDAPRLNLARSSSVLIPEAPGRKGSGFRKQATLGDMKDPHNILHRMSTGEVAQTNGPAAKQGSAKRMNYLSRLTAKTGMTEHRPSTFSRKVQVAALNSDFRICICHRRPTASPTTRS